MSGNGRSKKLLRAGIAGLVGIVPAVVTAPSSAAAATTLCVTYAQVVAYTSLPGSTGTSYFFFGSEVAVTAGIYNQQTTGIYRMPTIVNQSGTMVVVAHYNAETFSFTSKGWHALTYAC